MALRRHAIVHTGQAAVDRAFDSVKSVLDDYASKDLLDYVNLTGIVLAIGSNKITHKLGRQPVGWLTVDRDSACTLHRTAWDSTYLYLTSTAVSIVDLLVF